MHRQPLGLSPEMGSAGIISTSVHKLVARHLALGVRHANLPLKIYTVQFPGGSGMTSKSYQIAAESQLGDRREGIIDRVTHDA